MGLFSFVFRKPWNGTVLKIEHAEKVEDEKLFGNISSFHNLTDLQENLLGSETVIGLR
jgi:hypothetical protein